MSDFEKIAKEMTKRKLSRRDAMRLLAAAGISGILGANIISRPAFAETPKKGGRLRVGFAVGSPNDTLDPHKGATAMDQSTCANMYNRLVSIGPDLSPVAELAESWETKSTADEWTFKLRTGVQFQNGRTLSAADAVYSIQRMIAPDTASPVATILTDIDPARVKADGNNVVRIGLRRPNADLPCLLGDWHAVVVPDGHKDFSFGNAVGSGPFAIKEFNPGRNVLFARNDHYWHDNFPFVDELENIPIPDQAARASALSTGEIDLLEGVDPSTIDIFQKDQNLELHPTPSGAHRVLPMQIDAEPFNDVNVRLALKLLVDRKQMIDVVHKGFATIGNDQPISPVDKFFCTDLPQREYDPDKARSLLKQAGLENFVFQLSTAPVVTGALECALLLKDQAAKAGVNINVIREPADSYFDAVWLKKPWCVSEWNMRPVPDMMFSMAYTSAAPWNESHFRSEKFDKLLTEARVTTDFAKRKELYCELQRMVRDEGGTIVPFFLTLLDAAQRHVRGISRNPMGPLGQWRMETIWLDS